MSKGNNKNNYVLKCDGGALNNPGRGSSASVIFENGVIIDKKATYYSHTTNNAAEYNSLILGLKRCIKLGIKDIKIKMDSQLVVKQVLGEYKVRNENLKELHFQVLELLVKFDTFTIEHIYRNQNTDADELADLCILMKEDL